MKKRRVAIGREAQGPYLPQEIITEILSRVPVKPLTKFKTVCKSWHTLISNPYFINSQHLKQMANQNRVAFMLQQEYGFHPLAYKATPNRRILLEGDNPVDLLATCNGLLCICNSEDDFYLWNPTTTRARIIPSSTIQFPDHATWASVFFGLGYHPPSDDFKLIRVSIFDTKDFQTEVKVYSRNANEWKRIRDFPCEYPVEKPGVFVRGRVHWLVSRGEICALDLEDENYGLIKLPDDLSSRPVYCYDIGALGGNLVLFSSLDYCFDTYALWMLKAESWVKMKTAKECCMINDDRRLLRYEALCVLKDEILFRIDPVGSFLIYDFKEKRCTAVLAPKEKKEEWCTTFCFVESLASPNCSDP